MRSLVEAVTNSMADWEDAVVEREVFGTTEPAVVAAALDAFCTRHLGPPRGCLFYTSSVGCVAGLELEDGSRVVIKAHQPDKRRQRLEACQRAQRRLAAGGFPCPDPVLGPTPLGHGFATAERYLAAGRRGDARDPKVRRELARGLWRIACVETAGLESLGAAWFTALGGQTIWPRPHNALFDFGRDRPGAAWIDRIATRARAVPVCGRVVLGHFDWRIEHVGFDGGRLSASYDFDSLHLEHEPVVVGAAAHGFTAAWDDSVAEPAPRLSDILSFIADYERCRANPFTASERRLAIASCTYSLAYTARCQHALGRGAGLTEGERFAPVLLATARLLSPGTTPRPPRGV